MSWTLSAFADEASPSCEAQISALQRAGLSHIDIRNIDGFSIVALPLDQAREIKSKLIDAGISVAMFGSPLGKIDIADEIDSDLEKLRHLGELAPILGCNAVRIFSYYNKGEQPHDRWRQESLARLERLREVAAGCNLVLFHENERHIFGDFCDDVQAIAGLRDSHLKLIFDFDNYNQNGEDVWDNWTKLRDVTDAIHLKDSKKIDKQYQHMPAGQGDGQIAKILADAVARNWSGPITIEPHLSHSGAVAATGPSGVANEAYGKMPAPESFHIACEAAKNVLNEAGASWQ